VPRAAEWTGIPNPPARPSSNGFQGLSHGEKPGRSGSQYFCNHIVPYNFSSLTVCATFIGAGFEPITSIAAAVQQTGAMLRTDAVDVKIGWVGSLQAGGQWPGSRW